MRCEFIYFKYPEISDFSHKLPSYIAKQKGDVSRETSLLHYIYCFVLGDIVETVIPSPRFAP